jgi:hypothetical protein
MVRKARTEWAVDPFRVSFCGSGQTDLEFGGALHFRLLVGNVLDAPKVCIFANLRRRRKAVAAFDFAIAVQIEWNAANSFTLGCFSFRGASAQVSFTGGPNKQWLSDGFPGLFVRDGNARGLAGIFICCEFGDAQSFDTPHLDIVTRNIVVNQKRPLSLWNFENISLEPATLL